MTNLMELNHLKKTYPGFELDVSLNLEPGRISGIVGTNGAGKTTLFRTLLSMCRKDGGDIRIFGKAVDALTKEDKQQIGLVLADSFLPGLLKVEQCADTLKAFYPNFSREEFLRKVQAAGIDPGKKLKDCSTGMKARIKVLAAVCAHPRILVLDEPTAGLDVLARDEILDLVQEYMEREEGSVLISSHLSADLERLCDDFYFLENGKVVLHEDIPVLKDEYGILMTATETAKTLPQDYLLARLENPRTGTVSLLTDNRQFYLENYPGLACESGEIDSLIRVMTKGETL